MGCPKWTGVRLRDVLEKVGMRDDAVYIGYYGAIPTFLATLTKCRSVEASRYTKRSSLRRYLLLQ